MSRDWEKYWGSAEWAASRTTERGKLEAELVDTLRASQNATQQMDEAAHAAMGISASEGRCLDVIDRLGRVPAGTLAREAGVTTGAMTGVLDRLEEKGYARRVPDPDDRRKVLVEITEKQREEALRIYFPLKEMSDDWIEQRTPDELRLLIEFNRLSREINERRAAEVRAEPADGSADG